MPKLSPFLAVALAAVAAPCYADPTNVGPPSGAILDLAGSTIFNQTWTEYSVSFTAVFAATDITFLFRNDPGWTAMDDVSVTTGGGPNLMLNPGFELGTVGGAPVDWNYNNVYGAAAGGTVESAAAGCPGLTSFPRTGSNAWCDGAAQAYDAIDQIVATTIGDVYTITFWQNIDDVNAVAEPGGYSQLSTNGDVSDPHGNGVDTLVYVGATIPPPVPEPVSVILLGSVVLCLGGAFRRKLAK